MKKIAIIFLLSSFSIFCFSQDKQSIPSIEVKNLAGKIVNTSTFSNNGKPMVISFWATWCKPCVKELQAIAENYTDWQTETGVKIIAISIDDSKTINRVTPFVNGQGWDYEVYTDANGDFKRAMNVVNVPHTFLVDGNGKIVWQHTSFADGDEKKLFESIKKVVKGEEVK